MDVIATKRGGQKLCFEGFMYTQKIETTHKLIWRCVKRDDAVKCTAILQTSKNMDNPDMKKPHSHQPDENAITIAKCRDTMKRKATGQTKPDLHASRVVFLEFLFH